MNTQQNNTVSHRSEPMIALEIQKRSNTKFQAIKILLLNLNRVLKLLIIQNRKISYGNAIDSESIESISDILILVCSIESLFLMVTVLSSKV